MEPTTASAMSSLGPNATVNFPTLAAAVASVKATLVQQFGPITSETTEGSFSGSSNDVTVLALNFAGGGSDGSGPMQKKIAV